jgi:hypothetical protein
MEPGEERDGELTATVPRFFRYLNRRVQKLFAYPFRAHGERMLEASPSHSRFIFGDTGTTASFIGSYER